MNIGLFTDTFYPQINGVSTSVLMLKKNLTELGHKVYVFTTTDPAASANEEHAIIRLPSIPFASTRRLSGWYHPLIAKKIRDLKLDIIHTNTEFSLGIFGKTMARSLQIPVIHTMHTIYEDYTHYIIKLNSLQPIARMAARKLTARFCNSADLIIVPTVKVKDLLQLYGVYQNIVVIPTGIELEKFSKSHFTSEEITNIKQELGITKDDKILINIGRIAEEKNIDEILFAMKNYLPEHPDLKLLFVGDGPAKTELETLTSKLGLEKQVIFAGEKPWNQIGLYYRLGDVFISASQSETQGITYIEALASGLPVVAKADKCLEGVVENGINGYTFLNDLEIIKALDQLLFDGKNKEQLSNKAVISSERFSAKHFALSVESLYQNLIETKYTAKKVS